MRNLLSFLAISGILLLFLPIYFMRRKLARMADDDLKKIDREDWKKQKKFGSYTRLVSRTTWGGILFTISLLYVAADGLTNAWLIAYILVAILLMVWGLLAFRRELAEIKSFN